jgi:hypothetical protein
LRQGHVSEEDYVRMTQEIVLNRRYVSSLGRGRWNGPRMIRLILNILLAVSCLVTGCQRLPDIE